MSGKWIGALVCIALLVVGGARFYTANVMNANVINELQENPEGERAGIVMLITFPDGKVLPVNYLREGKKVFAGADGTWWRDFQGEGMTVSLAIRGDEIEGHGVVVLDDPELTQKIFKRLRPNVPVWLPDWLNGKLIVFTI